MSQFDPSPLLTTDALAARLQGPSARTLERWRREGLGPDWIKVGHQVRYRQSAVERWLEEQTHRNSVWKEKTSAAGTRR
jgi:predicted site-specific integrase-resolvase